jgi:predicted oxidoreductase
VALFENVIPVGANQIEFSLTQHTAMENGSLDQLLQKEIQPMCWSPLGSVFKEETAKTIRIKKVLKTLTKKYKCTEETILLAFILKHPAKVSPVIGTTNKQRILNANKALDIDLELEDWFFLLRSSKGKEVD